MSTQHTEETKEPWRALFASLLSEAPDALTQARARFETLRPWELPTHRNEIRLYFVCLSLFGDPSCAPKLKIALSHSASHREDWLSSALRYVSYFGGNAQALLRLGADPNTRLNHTPVLHLAAQHGQMAVVQALVQANANMFATNSNGIMAFITASSFGHSEISHFLLNRMKERIPPQFTLYSGHRSHISHPVPESKQDTQEIDPHTMLRSAITANRPDIIASLAKNPETGINTPDEQDDTPLLFAILHRAPSRVIAALLAAGVDTSGDSFFKALNLAITNRRKDLLLLFRNHFSAKRPDFLPIFTAAALRCMILSCQPDMKNMIPLLEPHLRGIVNLSDAEGYTPLLLAVAQNSPLSVIEALLEAGADPRSLTQYNSFSALDLAVLTSRPDVVFALGVHIQAHFPDAPASLWNNAALAAVEQSDTSLLPFLTRYADNLQEYRTEDDDEFSLLHVAIDHLSQENGFAVFSYLINELHLDPHSYDGECVSALMLGCTRGHVDAVHLMLCKAPNIDEAFYRDLCFEDEECNFPIVFEEPNALHCIRLVLAVDRNINRANFPGFLTPLAEDVAQLRRMAQDPLARRALPSDTPEILRLKDLAEKVAEIEAARGAEASAGHGR